MECRDGFLRAAQFDEQIARHFHVVDVIGRECERGLHIVERTLVVAGVHPHQRTQTQKGSSVRAMLVERCDFPLRGFELLVRQCRLVQIGVQAEKVDAQLGRVKTAFHRRSRQVGQGRSVFQRGVRVIVRQLGDLGSNGVQAIEIRAEPGGAREEWGGALDLVRGNLRLGG